jgi:hypothetical protein
LPAWTAVHRAEAKDGKATVITRVFLENTTYYDWKNVGTLTLNTGALNAANEGNVSVEDLFAERTDFSLERQRRIFFDVTVDAEVTIPNWVYRPAATADETTANAKNPFATVVVKATKKNLPEGSFQFVVGHFLLTAPTDVLKAKLKGEEQKLAIADTRILAKMKPNPATVSQIFSIRDGNITYAEQRQTDFTLGPVIVKGLGPITVEFPVDPDWAGAQPDSSEFSVKKIYTPKVNIDLYAAEAAKRTRSLIESSTKQRVANLLTLSANDLQRLLDPKVCATAEIKGALTSVGNRQKKLTADLAAFKDRQAALNKAKLLILQRQPSGQTAEFYQLNAKTLLAESAEVQRLTSEIDKLEQNKLDATREFERFILKLSMPAP